MANDNNLRATDVEKQINKFEEIIEALEQKIIELKKEGRERYRFDILTNFFRDCKETLSPWEIIVFCLKISGHTHRQIEGVNKMSLKKSTTHRTYIKAIQKLTQFYKKEN